MVHKTAIQCSTRCPNPFAGQSPIGPSARHLDGRRSRASYCRSRRIRTRFPRLTYVWRKIPQGRQSAWSRTRERLLTPRSRRFGRATSERTLTWGWLRGLATTETDIRSKSRSDPFQPSDLSRGFGASGARRLPGNTDDAPERPQLPGISGPPFSHPEAPPSRPAARMQACRSRHSGSRIRSPGAAPKGCHATCNAGRR